MPTPKDKPDDSAVLRTALRAIYDECDNYADCDDGPDGIANRPNLAMRVQMMIGNFSLGTITGINTAEDDAMAAHSMAATIADLTKQRDDLAATVAGLRVALEDTRKFFQSMLGPVGSKGALCWSEGQYGKGMAAGIVSCIDHFDRITKPALAASPAEHAAQIKSEVVREAARMLHVMPCLCSNRLLDLAIRLGQKVNTA